MKQDVFGDSKKLCVYIFLIAVKVFFHPMWNVSHLLTIIVASSFSELRIILSS